MAESQRGIVEWEIHAGAGKGGRNSQAEWERGAQAWHSDGLGSTDSTSSPSSFKSNLRSWIFRIKFWISTWPKCTSGCEKSTAVCGKRQEMGRTWIWRNSLIG